MRMTDKERAYYEWRRANWKSLSARERLRILNNDLNNEMIPQVRARLNWYVLVIVVGLLWYIVASFVELVRWIVR
jgi:hypothetical protein